MDRTPLIKGMFINSHIEKLRREKGDAAVNELHVRLGKFDDFNSLDDYPVRDEVKVIEIVLELLNDGKVDPNHTFEAGRLHFRNFAGTTYGAMIMGLFPHTSDGFKSLLLRAPAIARFVLRNTNFTSEDLGENAVRIVMENNDYPIEHFRGLFYEWAIYWGVREPTVHMRETAPKTYEYTVQWA